MKCYDFDWQINEFMIYCRSTQLRDVFMERLSKNSDVIAHNTAVTAYYSKINAELTDALGFMVALK